MNFKHLLAAIAVAVMGSASAQTVEKKLPLYMDINVGHSANFSDKTTANLGFDLNYTFAKRFSAHAVVDASHFIPKSGIINNFNTTTNVGGGLGYIFHKADSDWADDLLIKASVTRSMGNVYYRNTACKIGFHSNVSRIAGASAGLTYGIGYTMVNFDNKAEKTFHGAYVSIGLRL